MATNNVSVNYDDERFGKVESDKQQAMTELENTYGGMIADSDSYYNAQIEASKEWADTQTKLQQDNTDFAIEKIEQQKDQARKDYLKEQSGAYVDWQKQSNQYGANAEQMAAAGLAGTGFSESSQVAMYNTYQNRVATARESYNQAVLNYNNSIKEAQLQNNSILAEIAYNSLQAQLELSLQGFQYKNNLILEQANKKVELDNMYYNRYQDVVNQINTENSMAEQIRQWEETEKRIVEENQLDREFQASQAVLDRQHEEKMADLDRKFKAMEADIDRKHDMALLNAKTQAEKEAAEREYRHEMDKLDQQHKNDKAILDRQLANDKELLKEQAKYNKSSGSSDNNSKINKPGGIVDTIKNALKGENNKTNEVSTDYYKGSLNPDAKNGVMSNGYQPDNIGGKKLKKTGETIVVNTTTLSGEKRKVTQNVWKTPDGKLWYWEGRQNKYIQITNSGGGGRSF
jgi:hypothetical protein